MIEREIGIASSRAETVVENRHLLELNTIDDKAGRRNSAEIGRILSQCVRGRSSAWAFNSIFFSFGALFWRWMCGVHSHVWLKY